ncbi:MAG TPA: 16S rRNA (cytosine(967)-C(5))-methyltransferase RsmB [Candidatus Binatia bacterium]|nr:16S rRNA (cytosine(967)-C(5))-methyltransferase RsmB [Candidatus Binatia bacterium]
MGGGKPREIAVRILRRHAEDAGFIEDLLDLEVGKSSLESVDRRLVQELVFGVIRWQGTLDWLIGRKTKGRTQKQVLQILLRLGLYQIFWLERIPEHAAVHETVELAKQLGFGPQAGFINAVLRGYIREREATLAELEALKREQPAIGYSHPEWLYTRWRSQWDEDKVRALLEWNNTPPPTYARLNSIKAAAEALAKQWETEGVLFTPRQWDWTEPDTVFELRSHPSLATLPSFQQGLFYIQDPSTLLAVRLFDPKPGEAILDLCAAPGGKTTYIAQLMGNRGYIMAQDADLRRRELVRENCDRLGIRIVNLSRATTAFNPDLSEPYDRVLVDVPCSNTGVMRRRVDLRWRIQPAELRRLAKTQFDLLTRAAAQVKVGGIIVYSTCSLEPEENGELVQKFLAKDTRFKLDTERALLPFQDSVDGAYVARLVLQT